MNELKQTTNYPANGQQMHEDLYLNIQESSNLYGQLQERKRKRQSWNSK